MPWLKAGDNAATHPIVMRVLSLPLLRGRQQIDEREVVLNELFGFVVRCALQSAGHTTDYVLEEGTLWMIGGPRTERLIQLGLKSGYFTKIRHLGLTAYKLVDDPEFLHMRLKAEMEWEQQQRADSSNPALTVPVRLRDGDACRYCSVVVNFAARKGNRAGTYDHRQPGQQARTPADLVVACQACNSSRRDFADADDRIPLLQPPVNPFYSTSTAAFLAKHGHTVTPTEDLRPGTFPDTAHSDPGTTGATRQPPKGRAPVTTAVTAGSADSADLLPTESGFAGSGRVGTGSAAVTQPNAAGIGRSRRSRRGRPRTGATT